MIGIYKITNPISQIYIGQSKDIEQRFKSYKSMTSSVNGKLKASFIKYGADNHIFEIIEECFLEELNNKERFWQDKLNSIHDGLNSNETKPIVKRERRLTYGEHTAMLSIRVPESKKDEILNKFYNILDTYIISSVISSEKKSNPTDDTLEVIVENNAPEWATDPKYKQVLKKSADIVYSVPNTKPKFTPNATKNTVDMEALRAMANGENLKSELFATKKKPIDEIYDCIIVERGIPQETDRIYYGSNNRIAFCDRDDSTVYYINWEGKYYRFVNSGQFNKFLKDNNIK